MIVAISFRSEGPFDLEKFQHFLTDSLPDTVFRAKGLLSFSQSTLSYIFQLSGKHYSLDVDEQARPAGNQWVLTGQNRDAEQIQTGLSAGLT